MLFSTALEGYVINDKHPKSIRVACDRRGLPKERKFPDSDCPLQATTLWGVGSSTVSGLATLRGPTC